MAYIKVFSVLSKEGMVTKAGHQGCRWLQHLRLHTSVMKRAAQGWCTLQGPPRVRGMPQRAGGRDRYILTANRENSILA